MSKHFTADEGFTPGALLHYGIDHLKAAKYLLEGSAAYFDSTGYLAHMGMKLMLKGWLPFDTGALGAGVV